MMKRILKRPMFKMGGDVENVGIMDGMRNRYQDPPNAPVGSPRDERLQRRLQMINALSPQPNLNQFLIDFGLNLASGPPRGNILSTAAAAARDPFQRFMATQQTADKTKAALALEALTDDDRIAAEKTAELMSKTEGNKFFGKYNEALNFVLDKAAQEASPFRKTANPEERAINALTDRDGDFRMSEFDAQKAVPYFNKLTEIVSDFDKKEIPIDTRNPFRHAKRSKKNYQTGLAYINVRSGDVERFDPDNPKADSQGFVVISDLVDLPEL
jgi:hypothetical protein